jgi:hypothetical protein
LQFRRVFLVFIFVYLLENRGYLLIEQLLEFLLGVFVEIVLRTELLSENSCVVAFENNDPSLIVWSKVYINKEQRSFTL